jgi:hypothetical protein
MKKSHLIIGVAAGTGLLYYLACKGSGIKWLNAIGDLTPPPGYTLVANEGGIRTFDLPTNVAYGANGHYLYLKGVTGTIQFSPGTFGGDPIRNITKGGFAEITTTISKADLEAQAQLADQQKALLQAQAQNTLAQQAASATTSNTKKYLLYGGIGLAVIIGGFFLTKGLRKK